MASLLLRGFALGLAVAAAPGPIFFLCLRRTLVRGRPYGLASGLGIATADGIYAAVASFGVAAVAADLAGGRRVLSIAGGVVLIGLGARILFERRSSRNDPPPATGAGLAWAYLSNLGLTITNPATIISFAALAATLGAGSGFARPAALAGGVLLGSSTWWCLLAFGASLVRTRITPRLIRGINVFSGLAIAVLPSSSRCGRPGLLTFRPKPRRSTACQVFAGDPGVFRSPRQDAATPPKRLLPGHPVTAGHRIHTVDVFAEKPLSGNQLGVVLGAEDIPSEAMQRIAKEINISETLVLPPKDPSHVARVRIFTPASVLPFAGHPTVGTAWVLAKEGLVPGGALDFVLEEGVGAVPVRGVEGPGGLRFWMTHPKLSFGDVFPRRAQLASALGLAETDLLPEVPIQAVSTGNPFLFVGLRDARAVDAAVWNQQRLSDVFAGEAPLGVFLFAPHGDHWLYSRMSWTSRRILRPARPAVRSAHWRSSTDLCRRGPESRSSASRARRWAARASSTSSSPTAPATCRNGSRSEDR